MIKFLYIFFISLAIFSASYLPSYLSKKPEPTLNIFVWGDFFPEETFRQFEKETGIKINPNYYTSNEELILKLEKTQGAHFDLLFPSDYAVTSLKEKNLLKPLDKKRLTHLQRIDPPLLNRPFDPENTFSLPYFWEIYGLTIDGSLDSLFDGNRRVVMMQDPVEIFSVASHYLNSPKETAPVLDLLKRQKEFIEAYTDHRAHYLVSSIDPPIAILRSSFFFKHSDTLSHFYPPKNGTFATIENVALSASSEHVDEAYKFIEFIYRPEIMALQIDKGPLFPACRDALTFTTIPLTPRYFELLETLSPNDLYFFNIPSETVRPLWVEVQAL